MKSAHSPFIKVTKNTKPPLSSEQKVLLNRHGNQLFNEGKIEEAKQIFITTGYSDGLTRVGDYYVACGKDFEALQLYCHAKNKRKFEPLVKSLVKMIKILIDTDKKGV